MAPSVHPRKWHWRARYFTAVEILFSIHLAPLYKIIKEKKESFNDNLPVRSMKPKKTILCVDDNEQALSIRKIMLETRGYRVLACNSGEKALEAFRCGGIDLVLTDLIMPGVDGSRLIEEIKGISPQIPAILISGRVKIYERETLADVFLPKGMYEPAELLERIRLLLVRKRGPKRHVDPHIRIPEVNHATVA
jgi:two-component system response regulator CpxR